ncbi:MAG: hypoxanthine phosphoribosyltransferase [Anaerolineae bacterium]|jgi:hypoxanthine phosphoribosyltransferase|nr:hypoxanthine phosphoribosyltransferase [Anaerolineae bacterium]
MQHPYQHYLKEVLLDEATLQARIAQLGAQISHDYASSTSLILICILKGGVMFMTDLARKIDVPHEMDFMAVSSYGKGARSTNRNVRIDHDLTVGVTGKDVLIVEDIIDSGFTLSRVVEMLWTRKPTSLKICTLLDKPARRQVPMVVDYVGFTIEDKFVFGYGLDLDERFRNLPFVGVVDLDKLSHD